MSVDASRRGWAHPHRPNQGLSNEWWTPKHVFEALGLTFDLDPCAPDGGVPWIPAEHHYSIGVDGLSRPWFGRVWLNPPYGREAGAWMVKLASHNHGIALVFSRTDVEWWHLAVPSATAVCFVRGRLTFIPGSGQSAPGNSGGPSALIAYGDDCAQAVEKSGLGLTYYTTSDRKLRCATCVGLSTIFDLPETPSRGQSEAAAAPAQGKRL